MKTKVVYFEQNGVKMYVGAVPAKQLIDENRYRVEGWSLSNPDGYQRPLQERRVKDAAWYLMEAEGWFPTSVLLSVREQISFNPVGGIGDIQLGELEIPDDSAVWIIDGQHRVGALRHAITKGHTVLNEYMVPVIFVLNPERLTEIRMFYIVNSRAKSVPADIADRHLQKVAQTHGEMYLRENEAQQDKKAEKSVVRARAVEIVDHLMKTSPVWNEFIAVPGEPLPHPKAVKHHTLVSSLLEGPLKDGAFLRLQTRDAAELIARYWEAINNIFEEAIDNPDEYTIQRSIGIYSLHMIFPDVFERCNEIRDRSTQKMTAILASMGIDSEFWHTAPGRGDVRTFGTGLKSVRMLAHSLREMLPKLVLAGM